MTEPPTDEEVATLTRALYPIEWASPGVPKVGTPGDIWYRYRLTYRDQGTKLEEAMGLLDDALLSSIWDKVERIAFWEKVETFVRHHRVATVDKAECAPSPAGDTGRARVRYIGASDDQVRWGDNNDPRGILIEGQVYQVVAEEVHSWHTKLTLAGHEKLRFNSVSFKPEDADRDTCARCGGDFRGHGKDGPYGDHIFMAFTAAPHLLAERDAARQEAARWREMLPVRSKEIHLLSDSHKHRMTEDGGVIAGRLPWDDCPYEPCNSDRAALGGPQ